MRVCLASLHPRLPSGQIAGVVGLARALVRLGVEVRLVTAAGDDLLSGDRLTAVEASPPWRWPGRIGQTLQRLARAACAVDLVQLNLPTPAFALLGDLLQRLLPVPVVVGFEAHLAETGQLLRGRQLWTAPRFYLPRLLVNNGLWARCTGHLCARYIVSSSLQARELLALGYPAARVSVLPNLIDEEKLRRSDRSAARRRLGLPEGRLVAYVGHYHPVKGVETLIAAFGRCRERLPASHLVLAWSGLGDPRPVEAAIGRSRLDGRVLRLGRVPVGLLLSAVDLLALPYRFTMGQSAYPGLVLEALAIGVPLVTSALPLLQELLGPDQAALLVPPDDSQALAAALECLLTDPVLAHRMVAAQAQLWHTRLAPAVVARRYLDLYREIRSTWSGRGCR
jgi:glycosyltransferase involved in cell wall biosynthesis